MTLDSLKELIEQTSSYKLPDISKTNALITEPDMTKAIEDQQEIRAKEETRQAEQLQNDLQTHLEYLILNLRYVLH